MEEGVQRYARIAFVLAAIFAFVTAVIPHPPPIPGHPSDVIQHFVAFATLATLSGYGYRRCSATKLFIGLTAFGGLIEIVQAIPALHRDSDIRDLGVDVVATLLALAVTRYLIISRSTDAQGQ